MNFEKMLRNLIQEQLEEKTRFPLLESPQRNITENGQSFLNESGFSRVRQMMLGLVPTIEMMAILTAENPNGQQAPPEFNREANAKLAQKLQSLNYGFIPIQGKFGGPENSFIIPNMTRQDAVDIGKEFDQESVIWGKKMSEDVGEPFFRFEYIETSDPSPRDSGERVRDVSLGGAKAQEREDYYSLVKGRKFYIPFFDDEYEGAKPADGGRRISLAKDELPDDERVDELVKKINYHVGKSLQESRTPKSRWHHRGLAKDYRRRLDELLVEDSKGE